VADPKRPLFILPDQQVVLGVLYMFFMGKSQDAGVILRYRVD
jgi:hypothetical protein